MQLSTSRSKMIKPTFPKKALIATGVFTAVWLIVFADWMWLRAIPRTDLGVREVPAAQNVEESDLQAPQEDKEDANEEAATETGDEEAAAKTEEAPPPATKKKKRRKPTASQPEAEETDSGKPGANDQSADGANASDSNASGTSEGKDADAEETDESTTAADGPPGTDASQPVMASAGWGITLAELIHWIVFSAGVPVAVGWIFWATWPVRRDPITLALVVTGAYVFLWQWGVFASDALVLDVLRTYVARIGIAGFFLIGLAWVVWLVEQASQHYEAERTASRRKRAPLWEVAQHEKLQSLHQPEEKIWNPLDPQSWYYGRAKKLNQSLTALISYSILFLALFFLATQIGGCQEIYEMPAGGGQETQIAQTVKVQKVIRKKYVVNPFSAILFEVPPIEEVKLQLNEITKHAYTIGQGMGEGAGFSGGTKRGKVRFIRLEYAGGDWNQDFGIGADLNMLIEYNIRTKHPVATRTESRTIDQLKNFQIGKSPPMVYLTGQRNISLSKNEVKALREYMLEKRGMVFGDNGGSWHFHNQFFGMMRQVLPNVRPVRVPLDDQIHKVPYQIPFLPYVAPHGGRDAWGWKVEGRWVCYYHPGDIGDAWSDGHSGVDRRVWEYCYQLGTNVIFYAHAEYNKWLQAQQKD